MLWLTLNRIPITFPEVASVSHDGDDAQIFHNTSGRWIPIFHLSTKSSSRPLSDPNRFFLRNNDQGESTKENPQIPAKCVEITLPTKISATPYDT
ncbi:hypothetical protein LY76DRAFT_269987 [Colletotrichum caudatum]|nr:hypothetical protein LY76DRAFT_269987 [Colletotrichum caudatum]